MTQIFRLNGRTEAEEQPDEPIKLLEVNEATITAGIMPLSFRSLPERGIDYPSVIVEVTPEEFDKIQAHDLKLPDGWTVGTLIPRPPENGDE